MYLNVGFNEHLTLCLDRERVPPWHVIIQIDHLLAELGFVLVSLSGRASLRKLVNLVVINFIPCFFNSGWIFESSAWGHGGHLQFGGEDYGPGVGLSIASKPRKYQQVLVHRPFLC